jgi:malonyl-CoA O-methyltransferase
VADRDDGPRLLEPTAAYRLWAASYPPYAHNPLMQAEERAVLSLLPEDLSDKCVLDAGCGTGRYVMHALRRGARLVAGVDQSREMLDRANMELSAQRAAGAVPDGGKRVAATPGDHALSNALLLHASILALPLPDQWADLTICALSLGHLPSLRPALSELRRVTKVNGAIICSDFHPIGHTLGWQRSFKSHGQNYAVRYFTHSPRDWQRACTEFHLSVLAVLEPHLDPRDIPPEASFDGAALVLPVAIAYHLLRT